MECWICNKKAVVRYSPDLDIRGVGACKRHKTKVLAAMYLAIHGDGSLLNELQFKPKDKHARSRNSNKT